MQANPEQGHAATGRDTTDLTAESVQQFAPGLTAGDPEPWEP
ncbi:hypothetical protein [Nocardia salmonicida]